MTKIKITDSMKEFLTKKGLTAKSLLLNVDDGGKYSVSGGSCSIGDKFAIVYLDQDDPDYPIAVENNAGLNLHTSKYTLTFFTDGLVLDTKGTSVVLRDNSGMKDGAVNVVDGAKILAQNSQGMTGPAKSC